MVEFHTISAKDQNRLHQFGYKKSLPRILIGYVCAGGIWKGGILVADVEELEKMDASENSCSETQCNGGSHAITSRICIPFRSWKYRKIGLKR